MIPVTEPGIDIRVHPIAALFPMMGAAESANLDASLLANGQLERCVTLEVEVDGVRETILIDGRNRWRGCRKVGLEPLTRPYQGREGEVGKYILSSNIERRHLDPGQVAVVVAQALPLIEQEAQARKRATQWKPGVSPNPDGRRGKEQVNLKSGSPDPAAKEQVNPKTGSPVRDVAKMHANSTAGQIAEIAQGSRHTAQQAIKLVKQSPEMVAKVVRGDLTLNEAVAQLKPAQAPVVWDQGRALVALRVALDRQLRACPPDHQDGFCAEILTMVNDLCGPPSKAAAPVDGPRAAGGPESRSTGMPAAPGIPAAPVPPAPTPPPAAPAVAVLPSPVAPPPAAPSVETQSRFAIVDQFTVSTVIDAEFLKQKSVRRTIPPKPEWVTVYSALIGYAMDGFKWCDAYLQKGWSCGKGKMKDWQAAVRVWKNNRWGQGVVTLAAVREISGRNPYDLRHEPPHWPNLLRRVGSDRRWDPDVIEDECRKEWGELKLSCREEVLKLFDNP